MARKKKPNPKTASPASRPSKGQDRVLIANRGEIAIRVARTCRAMGLGTVMVYSDADRDAEHTRYGDQAEYLGPSAPRESYLAISKVIAAAKRSGATLIHPGYGFLSERPEFAEACRDAGLTFVGPTAESMRLMGDKIRARRTVDELKIPRVPGSPGAVRDATEAAKFAKEAGYPVLLKAAAGGGGKGMRRVDAEKDIASAFEGASREALSAFGDGSMYVEKLVLKPHHIEVQVFGDGKGGGVHLGERECSIQRRHQKVWEETPSPLMERFAKAREKMFDAALKIVAHVKYAGAGTLEFIADESGNFYFLEMNTRLQVEHPVTEWVTGVDLVEWQLKLALGELKLPATAPARRGSAVEVRLYAEDPRTFLPAPGKLGNIRLPMGVGVRSDSVFTAPGEVSSFYDPMIAKISVWAEKREDAIRRLSVALNETRADAPQNFEGVEQGSLRTNLTFLRRLAVHSRVREGDTPTDLIAAQPELTAALPGPDQLTLEAAFALTVGQTGFETQSSLASETGLRSLWTERARFEQLRGFEEGQG